MVACTAPAALHTKENSSFKLARWVWPCRRVEVELEVLVVVVEVVLGVSQSVQVGNLSPVIHPHPETHPETSPLSCFVWEPLWGGSYSLLCLGPQGQTKSRLAAWAWPHSDQWLAGWLTDWPSCSLVTLHSQTDWLNVTDCDWLPGWLVGWESFSVTDELDGGRRGQSVFQEIQNLW